eukprot:113112-Chlamydomonas_euryale.AAC.1
MRAAVRNNKYMSSFGSAPSPPSSARCSASKRPCTAPLPSSTTACCSAPARPHEAGGSKGGRQAKARACGRGRNGGRVSASVEKAPACFGSAPGRPHEAGGATAGWGGRGTGLCTWARRRPVACCSEGREAGMEGRRWREVERGRSGGREVGGAEGGRRGARSRWRQDRAWKEGGKMEEGRQSVRGEGNAGKEAACEWRGNEGRQLASGEG